MGVSRCQSNGTEQQACRGSLCYVTSTTYFCSRPRGVLTVDSIGGWCHNLKQHPVSSLLLLQGCKRRCTTLTGAPSTNWEPTCCSITSRCIACSADRMQMEASATRSDRLPGPEPRSLCRRDIELHLWQSRESFNISCGKADALIGREAAQQASLRWGPMARVGLSFFPAWRVIVQLDR